MRVLFLFTACTAMAGAGVKWGDIPLSFEPNAGQAPAKVLYLARGNSYTLYLAAGETVLAGNHRAPLRMKLPGANLSARAVGEGRQVSISNYFVGSDPSKWRTSVPNFGRVRYSGLYPGIDLVYYGHEGNLEYDWIVSPAADSKNIRLTFDSADRVRIDKQGDLVVLMGKNEYRHKKPVIYQEVAGKRIEIAGGWILHGKEAGFRIGTYDRGQPMVIDPVLYFATYLGGSGLDFANAIAIDKAGNTYITGGAGSTDFPTHNALQSSLKGAEDAFVTKINVNGSARVYSTYLGGGGPDEGKGIAVNSHGEVYVTGSTGSLDFPMMGAIQGTWGGSGDAFVTKLNSTGSALVYSTYLGGNSIDYGTALALDPAGNAYITGVTFSTNFPTVNPFQAVKGAQQDAFIAKINPAGTAWVYSTYLGGDAVDEGYAIAADASGNAYATGYTASTNFPLQSPYRNSNGASVDAFVTKLNPAGSALVYSTYLGGSATDYGTAIAVDSSGSAYVAGVAGSKDFPVFDAMQVKLAGGDDAFVTKFNPSGSALVYSTYIGGGSTDQPFGLAIDQAGNAYVTGRTNSADFPLTNPLQAIPTAFDIFVTELNASGTTRLFSTFLGGSGSESGLGIAVDSRGNIHVAGQSTSTDFPVVNAIQMQNGGGPVSEDAVVALIGNGSSGPPSIFNDFVRNGRSGALLYDPSNGQSYTALSNGNGTFSYPGNLFSPGFNIQITGDFNGDGRADLIVYNSQTALAYIGTGNGDGTFALQSLFWSPGYDFVATGDLNGDGKTDVALYNSVTGTMYSGISNGNGAFTYRYNLISTNLTFVRLADFTGDGKADLLLYRATDGLAFLGVGDGTGGFTFNPLSILPGYNLIDIGDLDGDGKADVILYNSTNGSAATGISNGTGGFRFTPLIFSPGFTSVRLADYTGDGMADLTVYNKSNAAADFGTGTGTGTFNFQSLFWSPGYDWVIPEDVDGDGRTDVILYNSATGTEYTGLSNGNGTFTYTYQYWGVGKVIAEDAASVFTPPPPLLSVVKTHTGNFALGRQNATYTITVSNASSAGPTAGGVTAAETIPTGLTLVSMQGTGWSCTNNSCTRGDSLAAGASYPAIIVTVNVASNAPSQVTNQVSVSGGGSAAASASDPTNVISATQVPGDFDGNGVPDLVWQNDQNRQVTVHYYGGSGAPTFQGWRSLNSTGIPGWHVVAVADFNGDGVPDLVWMNDTTRQVSVHYYGGTGGATFQGWNWLNSVGVPGWHVVAAADFNGDGVPDLVWMNDHTRQVTVHYYGGSGGATLKGWNWLNSAGVIGWSVVAAADFNGDGVPDLVWMDDTTRQVTVHYYGGSGGATLQGWNWLNSAGVPGWSVVAAADFNGNGVPDLVWMGDTTRQVTVHYYGGAGGAIIQGWNWLNAAGVPGWSIVN